LKNFEWLSLVKNQVTHLGNKPFGSKGIITIKTNIFLPPQRRPQQLPPQQRPPQQRPPQQRPPQQRPPQLVTQVTHLGSDTFRQQAF